MLPTDLSIALAQERIRDLLAETARASALPHRPGRDPLPHEHEEVLVSNTVISNQIRRRRQRPGGRVASIALGVLQAVDALSTPSATHLRYRIGT